MADPGEGPRGPGSPRLPLTFRPNWGPKGKENFLGDRAPPYLKVWIRHWSMMSYDYYTCILQVSEQDTSVLCLQFCWALTWLTEKGLLESYYLTISFFLALTVVPLRTTHSSFNETLLYLIKCRCCWQMVSEQLPHLQSQATWCLFGPGLCISLTCSTVTTYLCCFVKGWKEKIEKWKIAHHSEWCVRRTTLIFS